MTEPKEEDDGKDDDTRTMEEGRKQENETALERKESPRLVFFRHTRARTGDKELLDTLSILEEEKRGAKRGGALRKR